MSIRDSQFTKLDENRYRINIGFKQVIVDISKIDNIIHEIKDRFSEKGYELDLENIEEFLLDNTDLNVSLNSS